MPIQVSSSFCFLHMGEWVARFLVECRFCQLFSVARKSESVIIKVIGSKGEGSNPRCS